MQTNPTGTNPLDTDNAEINPEIDSCKIAQNRNVPSHLQMSGPRSPVQASLRSTSNPSPNIQPQMASQVGGETQAFTLAAGGMGTTSSHLDGTEPKLYAGMVNRAETARRRRSSAVKGDEMRRA